MAISQITNKSITDATITADDMATGAVEGAMTTQIGGRRNLIINGDMRIDQYNNGASISTHGVKVVDRWTTALTNGSASGITVQRSTTVPTGQGFVNSIVYTVGTGGSVSTGGSYGIQQRVEGYSVAPLHFGSAEAKQFTMSFWVRSSITGNYGIGLRNSAKDRAYVVEYTISSANTWEKKTITITADTSGTWVKDNGNGLDIFFDLGVGSTNSTTSGSWQAGNYIGLTGGVKLAETTGATFYLTGVQLEVGSVATPFEHRSFGEEMELCKRYYQKSFDYSTVPAFDASENQIGISMAYNASTATGGAIELGVEMRTTPTVTYYSRNVTTGNYWGMYKNTTWIVTTTGNNGSRSKRIQFYVQPSGAGMTAQNVYELSGNWTAEAEL